MGVEELKKACTSTATVLSSVSAEQLEAPTPCVGWTVRDVINHLIATSYVYAVACGTGSPPETGDTPDFSAGDVNVAFDIATKQAIAAFAAPGSMEKSMKLGHGDVPGEVAYRIATLDIFTHGWDLAKATGQSTDLDPALAIELIEIAANFIPDAIRSTEPGAAFAPRVEVAATAAEADKLAGFLGRQP